MSNLVQLCACAAGLKQAPCTAPAAVTEVATLCRLAAAAKPALLDAGSAADGASRVSSWLSACTSGGPVDVGALDGALATSAFVAGPAMSVADLAAYVAVTASPEAVAAATAFPNARRWLDAMQHGLRGAAAFKPVAKTLPAVVALPAAPHKLAPARKSKGGGGGASGGGDKKGGKKEKKPKKAKAPAAAPAPSGFSPEEEAAFACDIRVGLITKAYVKERTVLLLLLLLRRYYYYSSSSSSSYF